MDNHHEEGNTGSSPNKKFKRHSWLLLPCECQEAKSGLCDSSGNKMLPNYWPSSRPLEFRHLRDYAASLEFKKGREGASSIIQS